MRIDPCTRARSLVIAALTAMVSVVGASAATAADEAGMRESDSGVYRVSYTSSMEPIEINAMHEWILHIETAAGDPVAAAEISVGGGMPAHNHGLPTAPRVTEYLGEGNYRIRGMRFHMRGRWQVSFDIREADRADTITFELTL